nr:TadE/TadG family type IV pilus assembly protein [Mesorhizobium sp. LSHC416B00]
MIAPFLVMLLFGIFAFGWAMNAVSTVRYTLETSSRALQLNNTLSQSDIQAIATQKLVNLGLKNVIVTIATDPASGGDALPISAMPSSSLSRISTSIR